MVSRYDFQKPPAGEADWKIAVFPGALVQTIPERTGLYRFAHLVDENSATLFVDTSEFVEDNTILASYQYHEQKQQNDVGGKLESLYITPGISFEHHVCSLDEARRLKINLLIDENPKYNLLKFTVDDEGIEPAF